MIRSQSLRVGHFELHDLIARLSVNKSGATASSGKAGLIGPDVLKQFVFICDYRRGRLIFEKNQNFGLRDSYDRAGTWLSQQGDSFAVFDVIPGGPADLAGLKAEDTVIAIDGTETSKLILTEVRDRWKTAEPDSQRSGVVAVTASVLWTLNCIGIILSGCSQNGAGRYATRRGGNSPSNGARRN
jgi:hypothetical protein